DANNWSSIAEESYLIDYSKPLLTFLNDGNASDIDTFYTAQLEGNWLGYDPHSGIQAYEYAIGTLPQLNNVLDWSTAALSTSIIRLVSATVLGQVFYLSFLINSGSGLEEHFMSDRQGVLVGIIFDGVELEDISLFPPRARSEITSTALST